MLRCEIVVRAHQLPEHHDVIRVGYDRSMLSHKVNLFDMHHKYCDVMHVEDVLAELETSVPTRAAAE